MSSNNVKISKTLFKSRIGTAGLLLLVLVASMVCMIPFRDSHLIRLEKIKTGDQAESFFYARCDFNTLDWNEYARLKQEYETELDELPDYYAVNEKRTTEISAKIEQFYDLICSCQNSGNNDVCNDVLSLSVDDVQAIADFPKEIFMSEVTGILKQGILPDEVRKTVLGNRNKEKIPICVIYPSSGASFRAVKIKDVLCVSDAACRIAGLFPCMKGKDEKFHMQLEKLMYDYIGAEGNLSEDAKYKENKRAVLKKELEKRLASVPCTKTCRRGDLVLARGVTVTDQNKHMVDDYCMALREKEDHSLGPVARRWLKKFAIACVVLAFTVIYIYHIHPEIRFNSRKILVVSIIAIMSIILNRVTLSFYDWLCSNTGMPVYLLVLIIPLAVPAALISVIYGLRMAIFVVIYSSCVTAISLDGITQLVSGMSGVALDQSFVVFLSGLFTGAAAAYAVRTCSDYKKFTMRIFICAVVVMLVVGGTFLFGKVVYIEERNVLKIAGSLILFNGFLTATLSLLMLMLLESFGVTTNIYYYALSNTNNRLLNQMQEMANGTFHHSQSVSRIAGKAARKVKANVFRVKACAWYHDVGKLKNPAWFAENQTKRTGNPLESMTPEAAVACLRSHVDYGVELAKKNKLPRAIIETIREHHGTDYISYFYQNLKEKPENDAPYRYPGPIPSDKESVIIMFADTADAINSSCPDITKDELRAKLEDVLRKKVENGQLKDAWITTSEIYTILDVLADELAGVKQDGSRGTGAGYEDKRKEAKS